MEIKVVGYGFIDDNDHFTFYHFLENGVVLSRDEDMPEGAYEFYTGVPLVLDNLFISDEKIFLKLFGAWDD